MTPGQPTAPKTKGFTPYEEPEPGDSFWYVHVLTQKRPSKSKLHSKHQTKEQAIAKADEVAKTSAQSLFAVVVSDPHGMVVYASPFVVRNHI